MAMNFVAELVSAGMLIIILAYYYRSVRVETQRNRWFSLSLWAAIAGCIINTLSIITISYAARIPLWTAYLANDIFFVFYPLMIVLLCGYFANIMREESGKEGQNPLFVAASIILYVIIVAQVVINRFNGMLYSFDENFNYVRGNANSSPLFIVGAYILLSLVGLIINWRRCTRMTKSALVLILAVVGPLLVLQGFIPDVQLQGTAFTYAVIIVYLLYHNRGFELDPVAGCMNRESFFSALKRSYSASPPPAMLMVFFTNMRNINDDLGWRFGNDAINVASNYMMKVCGRDSVYLMTGTQFIVAVKENNYMAVVDKLVDHFSRDFEVKDKACKLSAKITVLDDREIYKKTSLVRILEYCYTTRLAGKSAGVVKCTPDVVADFEREISALSRIRALVDARQFQMYYRPLCNVSDDVERIVGLDPHVVIRDEELGVLTLASISEKLNAVELTDEIKFLVFERACELQATLHNKGLEYLTVATRLRIPMLSLDATYTRINEIIERTGANFRHISIQLEQDWNARAVNEELAVIVAKLRSMGFEVSLRDIDYTYLKSTLIAMPNFVVLDTNAFRENRSDSKEASVLGSIALMLRSNGIETIADGINSRMGLEEVKRNHINYAMGDALYPLASESELMQILDRNRAAVNTNAWEGFNAQATGLKFDL